MSDAAFRAPANRCFSLVARSSQIRLDLEVSFAYFNVFSIIIGPSC